MKMLILALLSSTAFANIKVVAPEKSLELWATNFRWTTTSKSTMSSIETEMKNQVRLSRAYDPDCLWAKECTPNPDSKLTAELERFAGEFKAETDGAFNITRTKEGKQYRDFGGMVQGFVIDRLRSQNKGAWAVNFGGDIYVSAESLPKALPLTIEDWEVQGMPLATVDMKSGWMLGSAANKSIIDPATGKAIVNPDFRKIVLFAKPDFSGTRLDAWSTALMVGGRRLLEKLWANKSYEGQWGYLYVDSNDSIQCSKNISCQKFNKNGRLVELTW